MTRRTKTAAAAANEAGQLAAQNETQASQPAGLEDTRTDTGTEAGNEAGNDNAAEEAAHLARLNSSAAEAEAEANAPHLVDTAPAPTVNLEAELSALLRVAVAVLGPMFPSIREIYTTETIQTVGAVVAPVCRKHGWLTQGVGGKYAEEMAAAVVLMPLGVATYAAVSADLEAKRAAKRKDPEPLPDLTGEAVAAPAAAPAPEKRVTFGAAMPEAVAA